MLGVTGKTEHSFPPDALRQVGNKQQVIYKHAISTIAPARTVDFREEEDLTTDK